MSRLKSVAAVGLLLMPMACGPAQPSPPPDAPAADSASPIAPRADAAPAAPPSAPDGASLDLTPPTLTPAAERGETGARNVLLSFARAVELAEYDQARALLSPADRQRWSEAAFAAIFADLGEVSVAVPTGTLDGPAGERRYTAPVTVTGHDEDGRPVRLEGTAVLRQVADAAAPDAPRWRFDSLSLDWTH